MEFTKEQNKKEFDLLCRYLKKHILEYGDNIGFPKSLALRLKGIACNKQYAKKDDLQIYPFLVILASARKNKKYLIRVLKNKKFNGETHKINYICTILEKDMNDLFALYKKNLIQEEKKHNNKISKEDVLCVNMNTYKKTSKLLREDLW